MGRTQTPLVILKSSIYPEGAAAHGPHPTQTSGGWASGRNPLGDSAKWGGVAAQGGEEPRKVCMCLPPGAAGDKGPGPRLSQYTL